MKTRFKIFGAAIALLFFASSTHAISLAINDGYYLGSITDGIPSSDANELSWVNELIDLGLGVVAASTSPAGETLARSLNDFGVLGDAENGDKTDDNSDRVVGSDSAYILGKYGNSSSLGQISHVWYIGSLAVGTMLDLDSADSGLSHTVLFDSDRPNPNPPPEVPDSGSTLLLLGISIAALRFFAKRR